MKPIRLTAVIASVIALGLSGPAVAQSTTKRAPDASTSTDGSENMKPRHEFDPYSTGSTPKALPMRTLEGAEASVPAHRFDRAPSSQKTTTPN